MQSTWGDQYLLPMLVLFWGYYQLSRMDVPLTDVTPETLYPLMKDEYCKFHVDIEEGYFLSIYGLLVKESGRFLLKEKLIAVYSMSNFDTIGNWLFSQIFTFHIFEEVIVCDKFLVTVVVLGIVNLGVYALSSDPLVPIEIKASPRGHQRELLAYPHTRKKYFRRLIPEKFIFLTSVIVRTPDSLLREKNFALGRLNGASNCVITDVTIFAIWFAIQASQSLAIWRLTNRLEEAIIPGKFSFNQWESVSFVKISFLLFGLLGTTIASFSFSITAFRFVHPLYACVIFFESSDLVLKTIHCTCLYIHSLCYKDFKNPKGAGALFSLPAILEHLTAIIRYFLYIWIGGFVNNKILPLCFLTPARCHFYGFIKAIKEKAIQKRCDISVKEE